MKRIERFCDRCQKKILTSRDDALQDTIDREYPGRDICPSCDISIKLAASTAARDAEQNLPPGSTARAMLENYQ
jgi:hypothetical protein